MKTKPNFFFDNMGFPNWGGPATWEFSPRNPVFFLTTTLSNSMPLCLKNLDLSMDLFRKGSTRNKYFGLQTSDCENVGAFLEFGDQFLMGGAVVGFFPPPGTFFWMDCIYGSVSAGQEKWPFNVLFFLSDPSPIIGNACH